MEAIEVAHIPQIKITKEILLLPYLLIPIFLALFSLDLLVFHGAILAVLPATPDELLTFAAFFGLPHIIASAFSFLDQEYWYANRTKLQIPIFIIAGLTMILGIRHLVFLVGVATIYHNVSQQFGIASMLLKARGAMFWFWKGSGIALMALAIARLYFPELEQRLGSTFSYAALGLAGLFTVATLVFRASVRIPTTVTKGALFIWLNYGLVATAMLFATANYAFFTLVIPTVVHDFTAFLFYATHDSNRNSERIYNLFYGWLQNIRLPIRVLCPLCAILLAFPFTYFADFKGLIWVDRITIALNFIHYYYEGFIWKNPSLHRRYVSVS